MSGIRWTEGEYEAYLATLAERSRAKESRRAPRHNRIAVPVADVEPAHVHAGKAKDSDLGLHSRVRIQVHSRRRRLADSDGISAKAVVDGLRAGGLLVDDSARYVESVTYSQERANIEETVIEVWEVLK